MSATTTASELNVSLEPHLAETLNKLVALLPETMSSELRLVLSEVHPTSSTRLPEKKSSNASISSGDVQQVISYTLLSSISAWTRSTEGQALLQDYKLSPSTYSMVALLAGTRASPERKFPPTSPIIGPENTSVSRELNDRRAVTAVLNALLSILGSGAATWWAADKLRWKDEWKVLLALLVAIVVASSEAVLFLIWDARRSNSMAKGCQRPLRKLREASPASHTNALTDGDSHLVALPAELAEQVSKSDVSNTPASTTVQTYHSADGLRERVPGAHRSKDIASGAVPAS